MLLDTVFWIIVYLQHYKSMPIVLIFDLKVPYLKEIYGLFIYLQIGYHIVPDSYKEEYWSLHKEEYAFKTTRTERSTRKDI